MKKVLFCFPHGLGDAVMLTPSLKKLKEINPDLYTGVAVMKRKDRDFKGLLSNLPFIPGGVLPILSDPWNDFTNYPDGLEGVLKEAQIVAKEKGFDETVLIPTANYGNGLELHKIFRIAYEIGAIFKHLEDLQTELAVTEEAEKLVEEFTKKYQRPFLVLHVKSGNPMKDLSPQETEELIEKYKEHTVFEFGRASTKRSILIPEDDMEFTKALVKKADNILAIDSIIMHIAGAFKKPLEAVFITTPVQQAIPLTYDCSVTIIDKKKEQTDNLIKYKKQVSELFPKQNTKVKLPHRYFIPMMPFLAHMLTFRCNAKCPYCIMNERGKHINRKELSSKEVLDWWNSVEHHNGRQLSLIGGEPTLYKDLVEVINNLDGYDITITTNCIGSFFENYKYKDIKLQKESALRINTSFHPRDISPKDYINHVQGMKEAGFYVDQTAFVDIPGSNKYKNEIEEVNKIIPLQPQPFIGFWSDKGGFDTIRKPEFLLPNEKYWDQKRAELQCGIKSYDFYREACGQEKSKIVYCPHGTLVLLISPDGFCYPCHHRLYHNLDPLFSIRDFREITLEDLKCSHFGFCNSCDIPRIYYGKDLKLFNFTNWYQEEK